jgi:intracellular multiplication protein IcmV
MRLGMAIRDVFKFTRKTFVNPTGWIDYDAVKNQTLGLWSIITSLFVVTTPTIVETYEEALVRLGVTDAEAQHRGVLYRRYALIFTLLGLIVFFYSFYLLAVHRTWHGLLLSLCASAVFFCQAFRFDFWSFQIRSRKLGADFNEWKKSFLGNKDTPE